MENKKTLIVNYFGMSTGGIERYIAQLMRYSAKEGHRVIWFTTDGVPENAKQSGIADNPGIEIVKFAGGRRKFLKKSPDLKLKENENVVMISFVPEDYIWAEQFRFKYKCKTFYHHLILMNFFGWLTYPEDEFNNSFLSKKRAEFSNKIAHQLDDNNNIRAFVDKQLIAYKNRYNLDVEISDDKYIKSFPPSESITEEELYQKAKNRKDEFIIVTCARFQFPHKGYILGLLDVFKDLKEKYSNVKLIVIGDGERETFNNRFNILPERVKSSITITGTLPFEEVLKIYRDSHLCVGLAGSIASSASIGLPSLVVRHNITDCETYGFYQDTDSVLRSDPGNNIFPYIENVLNCSEEEYVLLGINAVKRHRENITIDPAYILKETNMTSSPSVSKKDLRTNKKWAMISLLKKYIKNL